MEAEEAGVVAMEEMARVALEAAAVVGVGEEQEPICSCLNKTLPSGHIGKYCDKCIENSVFSCSLDTFSRPDPEHA